MCSIPFTQYLRPNGRKTQVTIERPKEVIEKAQAIMLKGFSFEIEELMNGMVSMTVEKPYDDNGPIAHKVCKNGPDVLINVDQLVDTAFKGLKLQK